MFIHIGRVRAGWRGLIVSGVCFIMPAACIVLALAWAYRRFGSTPAAEWLLYGIKPVIIAIILQALWNLDRTAIKGPLLLLIAVAVVVLYLLGVNELVLLFGGGLVIMLVRNRQRLRPGRAAPLAALLPLLSLPLTIAASAWLSAAHVQTGRPAPYIFTVGGAPSRFFPPSYRHAAAPSRCLISRQP
jgi:chromate transporter